ncbi:MAG TPA: IS21 family transposase [Longimicrobiales bacterium]|nr:IS21 family transposase [Longimicrobiales bacterium]
MTYREVAMWEVLNVLRRVGRGESKSAVARATGHDRKTVKRYVATAVELGWRPGLDEPTEALAASVAGRHHPAKGRSAGEAEDRLLPHRERIKGWLKPAPGEKRGLRLTKVQELLRREGIDVVYSSLHRFAVKHCGFGERGRMTVRMAECEPAEVAEVDFGRLGLVPHPESGRRRTLWAMPVVLGYSRHEYVHVTHSQKIPDLIGGLEDAWAFLGGVPRRLVIDNLAAAITKADRYDPIFQRTFEEYAAYRGFIIDPAPPRMPTGKPVVERNVPYVRESLFQGETWRDAGHVQEQAIVWCLTTAGMRIHGTTRKRPLTVFENEERAKLMPITRERFDPPSWGRCTVHPDHHVSFGKALYSAPTRYRGQSVWVRADSKLVRIYSRGELVKTHEKQPAGGRSTDHNDYPKELTSYTLRDPQRLIGQAQDLGPEIGRFMQELLSGELPWARLRQGQKLLRLAERYGTRRLEAACRRALAFELLNVRRVESIVRRDLEQLDLLSEERTDARVIPIQSRFLRAPESFTHTPHKEADHE